MNNIIDGFDEILSFAKTYGLPIEKKRAILREYLQTKILEYIYRDRNSNNLYFIGGTSLRLLRGLDRFSEDLDFDLGDIAHEQIREMMQNLSKTITRENITHDLYTNVTPRRAYYELRFTNLLAPLHIASDPSEKLTVKFDFESFWKGHTRERVLLSRYGFLIHVVSVPIGELLMQKLFAYLHRKETQPRDLYDIMWLSGRGSPDWTFAEHNHVSGTLLAEVKDKFLREKHRLPMFKRKLRPFLLEESHADKLDLFNEVLKQFAAAGSS